MCGIAGVFAFDNNSNFDPVSILKMTDIIKHRGPDDYGYFIADSDYKIYKSGHLTQEDLAKFKSCWRILFGHTRLAIIDLSEKGRQPMCDSDKKYWITYNGEIYNYLELKEELLQKGYKFISNTDTEVILNGYKEWGKDCVKRFNGMWAFAIWDVEKGELFCSRDRFGIKPFYYYFDSKIFLFGSEIKAILAGLNTKPKPNYNAIYRYLVQGFLCDDENTFFEKIRRLEPSHNLSISEKGYSKIERYWDYDNLSEDYDFENPEKTFYELLKDSVRLRLRSDVPVGVTLSGGLDSTSIVAMCDRLLDNNINSFSAVFDSYRYDESKYVEIVAKNYKINPHYIRPKQEDFIESLKKMIWHMDYPTLSRPAFSLFEIMKEIKKSKVKVILEGQGADEELAGYLHKYMFSYIFDLLQDKNLSILQKIKSLFFNMSYGYNHSCLKPFLYLVGKLFPSSRVIYKRFIGIEDILNIPNNLKKSAQSKLPKKFESKLMNQMYEDHRTFNLPYLLKYGDAISMAYSIESRLPFLDYRLVEFLFHLPYNKIMNEKHSKHILRESLKDVLPHEILYRNKIGFSTPISEWFKENTDSIVKPILLSKRCVDRGLYNVNKIKKLLNTQKKGRLDVSNYIFRILSVELWFEIFIDGEVSS